MAGTRGALPQEEDEVCQEEDGTDYEAWSGREGDEATSSQPIVQGGGQLADKCPAPDSSVRQQTQLDHDGALPPEAACSPGSEGFPAEDSVQKQCTSSLAEELTQLEGVECPDFSRLPLDSQEARSRWETNPVNINGSKSALHPEGTRSISAPRICFIQ